MGPIVATAICKSSSEASSKTEPLQKTFDSFN